MQNGKKGKQQLQSRIRVGDNFGNSVFCVHNSKNIYIFVTEMCDRSSKTKNILGWYVKFVCFELVVL